MEKKLWPKLYKKASSGKKVEEWELSVEGNVITVTHGYTDGKKQTNSRTVEEGKNIGRSNATTPEQQALAEAESDFKKKMDKGYKQTIEETDEATVLPMLAHDYNKRKHDIKYPCWVQPKLDGIRCISRPLDAFMMSRGAKEFYSMPHIKEELKQLYKLAKLSETFWLDGELYSDEITFQDITHIVKQTKKVDPEHTKVKYRIYDCFDTENLGMTFDSRKVMYEEMLKKFPAKHITVVPSNLVLDQDKFVTLHKQAVELGYEGIMIRNLDGKYALNTRSSDLQKYKLFQDAEFKIIGFKEGDGLEKGCIIWQCITDNQAEFWCRPTGTREAREKLYQECLKSNKYIGKKLTVKYFEMTDDGVPRFPVGKAIREKGI